jgi:TolB protein
VALATAFAAALSLGPAAGQAAFPGTNGRIVFSSDRSGNREIYVMRSSGGAVQRLTKTGLDDVSPAWSPDGKQIAWTHGPSGARSIDVMDADGSHVRRLTSSGNAEDPAWSPDGTKIAFTFARPGKQADVFVMGAGGGTRTRLTTSAGFDGEPAWSPDATKIVYTTAKDSSLVLAEMNADGTGAHRITNHRGYDRLAAYSPDGTQIAFTRSRGVPHAGAIRADLWVLRDGKAKRLVSKGASTSASWSPDGKKIVFMNNRSGRFDVYTLSLTGKTTRLTSAPGDDGDPDWQARP